MEAVPFKGMRKRLAWLLQAIGVRKSPFSVDTVFSSTEEEIASGSLIRCSISAKVSSGDYSYKLADILAADTPSGGKVREVLHRCIRLHAVPRAKGHTFVMLGLDDDLIKWTRSAFEEELGSISSITETTYRNKNTSWAHVAHPSGNLTDPQYERWCRGEGKKPKVLWAKAEVAFRSSVGDG